MYTIRKATFSDISEIKKIFRETIQNINIKDYSSEQISVWISRGSRRKRWAEYIRKQYFIVAVNNKNEIIGFSSVFFSGHLHLMYIHNKYQKQGIATILLCKIEEYLQENRVKKIITEASITAKPFFENKGYKMEAEQKVRIDDLYLTNYVMSKEL